MADGEKGETTVKVKNDTWQRLTALKSAPGETYDDVINTLIDRNRELEERVAELEEQLEDATE